ncbi:AI-2E family transporter [Acaryochloris marina]|uniref:AI-2E family transporter n=1 Tax=Acaryochloris marina TaxID=155978 RepID=UPI001BAF83F3|nr:AI-2E family transporter [Acaryochloris marina]QUY42917.1 AI-2E family transporter [Acaryochloris marina S15]
MKPSESSLTFSIASLLRLGVISLGLLLLWQLQNLVVVLMISIVLASTLAPIIQQVESLRAPRWLAVLGVYVSLIGAAITATLVIGPTITEQIQRIFIALPGYLDTLTTLIEESIMQMGISKPEDLGMINQLFDLQALTAWTFRSSQKLILQSVDITKGLLGGVFNLLLALILSAYMLSDSQRLLNGLVSLFPQPWEQRLADQVHPVSQRMGAYIQGRLLVSLILGTTVSIGLKLIGIAEVALGLGAIAGLTNLIPFFGPVLGAIPALLVAVAQGGWTVVWVFLLFVLIQNLETYVLDPLVVSPSVNVPPLYQLLAVLGGTQVLGIIGALIAPPWVAAGGVLIENLYLHPKREAEQNTQPAVETVS